MRRAAALSLLAAPLSAALLAAALLRPADAKGEPYVAVAPGVEYARHEEDGPVVVHVLTQKTARAQMNATQRQRLPAGLIRGPVSNQLPNQRRG